MKNLLINFFLIFFTFQGCVSKHSENDLPPNSLEDTLRLNKINTEINSNLRQLIEDKIRKHDGWFFEKDWLYFNYYFFKENNDLFVLEWVFTGFPDGFFTPEKENYNYSLTDIKDRKVVFIYKNEKDCHNLFPVTTESLNAAQLEKEKPYEGPIYDGDMFFQTYKINNTEGGYQFEKTKTNPLVLPLYKDQPEIIDQ